MNYIAKEIEDETGDCISVEWAEGYDTAHIEIFSRRNRSVGAVYLDRERLLQLIDTLVDISEKMV